MNTDSATLTSLSRIKHIAPLGVPSSCYSHLLKCCHSSLSYSDPKPSLTALPTAQYFSAVHVFRGVVKSGYTHHVLKITLKITEMIINIMDDFQFGNHKVGSLFSSYSTSLPPQNHQSSSPSPSYSSSSSFKNKPVSGLPLHPRSWSSATSGLGESKVWVLVLTPLQSLALFSIAWSAIPNSINSINFSGI